MTSKNLNYHHLFYFWTVGKKAFCVRRLSVLRAAVGVLKTAVRVAYWSIERAPSLSRLNGHRYYTGMLKSALGCNREYFHSQTPRDSNRLQAGGTRDFI
jgi:hypothetical protein